MNKIFTNCFNTMSFLTVAALILTAKGDQVSIVLASLSLTIYSEVMLHGVCGAIIGILTSYYTESLALITCAAGIGGVFGYNLLVVVFKYVAAYISAIKQVKINDNDIKEVVESSKQKEDK